MEDVLALLMSINSIAEGNKQTNMRQTVTGVTEAIYAMEANTRQIDTYLLAVALAVVIVADDDSVTCFLTYNYHGTKLT